jgi:hypothetical protein
MSWVFLYDHSYKKILENNNFIGVEICVENKVR